MIKKNKSIANDNKPRKQLLNKEKKEKKQRTQRQKTLQVIKTIHQKFKQNQQKWSKNINQQSKMRKDKHKNQTWGDNLITDNEWPIKSSTLRLMTQNVHGISSANQYMEWELALTYLDEMQVDISCMQELNLDMAKPQVQYDLQEKLKTMDKHAKLATSASPKIYNNSPYKMGGTSIITRGHLAGRIVKQGRDSLGRWSFITLAGKLHHKYTFINVYRVCYGKANEDGCTIRIQQERDLQQVDKTNCKLPKDP